ncbi:MAG TPA: hypothetical protein PL182_04060 [Pseudobdellovibrionaceae bacterium]|nr:hypothetical protein [Pseudobdellovibrionaceae bacterium]
MLSFENDSPIAGRAERSFQSPEVLFIGPDGLAAQGEKTCSMKRDGAKGEIVWDECLKQSPIQAWECDGRLRSKRFLLLLEDSDEGWSEIKWKGKSYFIRTKSLNVVSSFSVQQKLWEERLQIFKEDRSFREFMADLATCLSGTEREKCIGRFLQDSLLLPVVLFKGLCPGKKADGWSDWERLTREDLAQCFG